MKTFSLKLITVLVILSLFNLTSCSGDTDGKEVGITSIEFCRTSPIVIDLDSDTSLQGGYVLLERTEHDGQADGILFFSTDESVVTVECADVSELLVGYTLNAVGVGTAFIFAISEHGGVCSEMMSVSVVDGGASDETSEAEAREDTSPVGHASDEVTDIPSASDSGEYVLNTSSRKIHKSSCSSVSKIKAENRGVVDSLDDALTDGYERCKICFSEQ